MSERKRKQILKLWREGRNIWEISQIVGVSESQVQEVINAD